MNDLAHRVAVALLVACGLLSAALVPWDSGFAGVLLQAQHRYFLVGLLGASLVLSAWLPALRPAAVAASLLSKLAFLALVLGSAAPGVPDFVAYLEAAMALALAGAAAVLAREAWQEARWHGVLPLRSGA